MYVIVIPVMIGVLGTIPINLKSKLGEQNIRCCRDGVYFCNRLEYRKNVPRNKGYCYYLGLKREYTDDASIQ